MRYTSVLFRLGLIIPVCFALIAFESSHKLSVTSSAFSNGEMIPAKYSCEGAEMSPPLHIDNIPSDAKSLAIVLHDPDAPITGGFTHWVVWNIDVMADIPENYKGGETGMNSVSKHEYKGMCPQSGTHHYHFTVYALDTKLKIDINTDKNSLEEKMEGHILAKGKLTGKYQKDTDSKR